MIGGGWTLLAPLVGLSWTFLGLTTGLTMRGANSASLPSKSSTSAGRGRLELYVAGLGDPGEGEAGVLKYGSGELAALHRS